MYNAVGADQCDTRLPRATSALTERHFSGIACNVIANKRYSLSPLCVSGVNTAV